jgi:hypothetical protein
MFLKEFLYQYVSTYFLFLQKFCLFLFFKGLKNVALFLDCFTSSCFMELLNIHEFVSALGCLHLLDIFLDISTANALLLPAIVFLFQRGLSKQMCSCYWMFYLFLFCIESSCVHVPFLDVLCTEYLYLEKISKAFLQKAF